MQKDIQKKPRLLIVSDSALCMGMNKKVYAFEPVLRELENISNMFDKITWIGYGKCQENLIKNMRENNEKNIEFIILKKTGGRNILKKIGILLKMPPYFFLIKKNILEHDIIHTRAPSMPAFLAIVISFFDRERIYWHKYAGDWTTPIAPPFYRLQRALLKRARHTHVTINGKWPGQQKHILSFENPCLTKREYLQAKESGKNRSFDGKLNFCFIGNLNDDKGVGKIIEAFAGLKHSKIGSIHFIGDGAQREEYEKASENIPAVFHGFLLRAEMEQLLPRMHFLLLPSRSEGFPKVIAEAAAYGTIPVVSAISSIPQYIRDGENGFLLESIDVESLRSTLHYVLSLPADTLKKISKNTLMIPENFTYEYFASRIKKDILGEKT